MKWLKNLINTGGGPLIMSLPVFGGGTDIIEGSLGVRGPTADTNDGFVINPTSPTANLVNVVGMAAELDTNATSGADSNTTGTNYTTKKFIVNPDAIYLIEYSQITADTLLVTSVSGTTVTITSLEANLGRGYLYAAAGTGIGRLTHINTSASGSCVTKDTTGWDNTTRVVKILPRFRVAAIFNSTIDKLATQAAVGGTGFCILENMIEADSIPLTALDPKKHSPLTGLNSLNVKFYAQVIFTTYVTSNIA